ncbi:MAG: hypothetical protein DRQ89_11650 [Epsilonproteobacteria bacterium]|nr:MAG: hypothetical protein DRQ89_11650 [Campylobacterota bacterium]
MNIDENEIQRRLDLAGKGMQITGNYVNLQTKTEFTCINGHKRMMNPINAYVNGSCRSCKKVMVRGVGINDMPDLKTSQIDLSGKKGFNPFYSRWINMLDYCNNSTECTVCDNWLLFSNFYKWMVKQYWSGLKLSNKIIPGNTVFSPDTCVFIPKSLLGLIVYRPKNDLLPHGVRVHPHNYTPDKYTAFCAVDQKPKCLGTFTTSNEARIAYIEVKIAELEKWKARSLDERITHGLGLHIELLQSQLEEDSFL